MGAASAATYTTTPLSNMDPHVVESEVLRRFYSDIQNVMVHPGGVAAQLFQERVVSEVVVDEVDVSGRTQEEKSVAIMRSVGAAVRGDPANLLVFISVLEKFSESAPVARRMRDALRSEWLGE